MFAIKEKKKKMASSRDVRTIKICCLRSVGKSKNIHNTITAKN